MKMQVCTCGSAKLRVQAEIKAIAEIVLDTHLRADTYVTEEDISEIMLNPTTKVYCCDCKRVFRVSDWDFSHRPEITVAAAKETL
jgi:hypothetical protein